jgi:hypothetical protein
MATRPDEFTYRGTIRFKNQQRILYGFAWQDEDVPRHRHLGGRGALSAAGLTLAPWVT